MSGAGNHQAARASDGPPLTRGQLLVASGLGLAAFAGGSAVVAAATKGRSAATAAGVSRRFAASDGFVLLPERSDPLYVFGFKEVVHPDGSPWPDASVSEAVAQVKGKVENPAPILAVDQDSDFTLNLTNVGFQNRPDLDDSHTIHWHGFRNAIALFDGVPEVSIAVPTFKSFPYFYRPHDPGTYMYHCHFEDVEHVQMGMTGIVYVKPALGPAYAYNDSATAFDREFALLLNEIWTTPHDNSLRIQETVWTDYEPDYWVINGRSYPDTIKPTADPSLPSQPISSLVQVNPDDTVLLRFVNLGYEQHSMEAPGIAMRVVGEDATLLRGRDGTDLTYSRRVVYIGPGESRDVLFTAPAFDADAPTATDDVGTHNAYQLRNRNLQRLTNGGAPGLGGMVTEIRVYQGSPLPMQPAANRTFPL